MVSFEGLEALFLAWKSSINILQVLILKRKKIFVTKVFIWVRSGLGITKKAGN
jgi:hypothetical protein